MVSSEEAVQLGLASGLRDLPRSVADDSVDTEGGGQGVPDHHVAVEVTAPVLPARLDLASVARPEALVLITKEVTVIPAGAEVAASPPDALRGPGPPHALRVPEARRGAAIPVRLPRPLCEATVATVPATPLDTPLIDVDLLPPTVMAWASYVAGEVNEALPSLPSARPDARANATSTRREARSAGALLADVVVE